MTIFETFARERRELSNSELARLISLPESSCSDLLHTLQDIGYLMRTARSRRFYPTARLLAAAKDIARNDPISAMGAEALELLTEKTGETAFCGMLGRGHVKIIATHEGRHELRYVLNAGAKVGLHVSALGKSLLALLPEEEIREQLSLKPLQATTASTVTDRAALQKQIASVRQRGWAEVNGEGIEGVSALAVAGQIGDERFSVSIAGPTDRMLRNHGSYLQTLLQVKVLVFGQLPDQIGS
jgi:DNA-binding IclR family transcriptional regulator